MELVSPEGLRQDGRRPAELRAISCAVGPESLKSMVLDLEDDRFTRLGSDADTQTPPSQSQDSPGQQTAPERDSKEQGVSQSAPEQDNHTQSASQTQQEDSESKTGRESPIKIVGDGDVQVTGFHGSCDGFAVFTLGLTTVACALYGPVLPARRSDEDATRCTVVAEFREAAFATGRRPQSRFQNSSDQSSRSHVSTNQTRQYVERSATLAQVFEKVICVDRFPRTQITLCVEVLHDDGSAFPCAINACTLAIMAAGIPMYDMVVGCSAAYNKFSDSNKQSGHAPTTHDRTTERQGGGTGVDLNGIVVDVNRQEAGPAHSSNSRVCVLEAAVLANTSPPQVVMCELTSRLPFTKMQGLLAMAMDGCMYIHQRMNDAIRKYGKNVVQRPEAR